MGFQAAVRAPGGVVPRSSECEELWSWFGDAGRRGTLQRSTLEVVPLHLGCVAEIVIVITFGLYDIRAAIAY
jgi:hypothetical protein